VLVLVVSFSMTHLPDNPKYNQMLYLTIDCEGMCNEVAKVILQLSLCQILVGDEEKEDSKEDSDILIEINSDCLFEVFTDDVKKLLTHYSLDHEDLIMFSVYVKNHTTQEKNDES